MINTIKFKRYFRNPKLCFLWLLVLFPRLIRDDRTFLRILYYINFEKWPDLDNPQTFSEKIQWLKLYNRKPEYINMVDKYEAKKYVASIIGEEHIIPTIAVYDRAEDIDFDSLPNQFVLKCTHDSGGVVICKDKSSLNKKAAIKKLKKGLNRNFFWQTREWPYKNVQKRIIAEKYMADESGNDLNDYKFFCFNGEPKYCQVISDRSNNMSIDFFDEYWEHQPFHEPKTFPFSTKRLKKPKRLDEMLSMAKLLSNSFPFLRVDFYEINNKVYFGELTFYPTSGIGGFEPASWDMSFGKLIQLLEFGRG